MPKSNEEKPPKGNSVLKTDIHYWFSWVAKTIIIVQGVYWMGTHIVDAVTPSSRWQLKSEFNWINPFFKNPPACRPPLPQLTEAVSLTDPIFWHPSDSLDRYLKSRTSQSDIDSLAIAVVTPSGAIFQKGYGVLKANETDPEKRGLVDKDSIYRMASMTKMFNVLETLVLRDRGALNWDDPITKFLPNFTYNPQSWPEYLSKKNDTLPKPPHEPITIRQLASHMSGISRDYPPLGDQSPITFPVPPMHQFNPGDVHLPTRNEFLEALKDRPLIAPPYTYPIYSNTGFDILGWVNVEANAAAGDQSKEPKTYADLLKRDIFDHIGMNSSSFAISPEMAKHVAVAAENNLDTDLDFTDVSNPSGGQYSSLSDLSIFMQTLLEPSKENSVLSPYTIREWLRPIYGSNDDLTEVGALWEISKFPDSIGRRQRFYQKSGNLPSYHGHFIINPASSYGVVVLVTGHYAKTAQVAHEAIRRFQPVFDKLQQRSARDNYAGRWASRDGKMYHATIATRAGSLWIDSLVLNGTDILAWLQERTTGNAQPFALWNIGPERAGEFRVAIGRPALNDDPLLGCQPYWVAFDGLNERHIPIDLLYFEEIGKDGEKVLKIPGVGVEMTRVSRRV